MTTTPDTSPSLGSITQTCWVVRDIAATERFMGENLGVEQWTRFPDLAFGPDKCTYRGRPAAFVAHVSLAYLGEMQLELIQPVRGESIYSDFLERSGGGMHHVAFEPDDFEGALRDFADRGMTPVQQGEMAGGLMRFAYIEGSSHGVPYIEIAQVGPEMRAIYDSIRAA